MDDKGIKEKGSKTGKVVRCGFLFAHVVGLLRIRMMKRKEDIEPMSDVPQVTMMRVVLIAGRRCLVDD
jgi:hypothetical protein